MNLDLRMKGDAVEADKYLNVLHQEHIQLDKDAVDISNKVVAVS